MKSSATVSPDGLYRYDLTREWGEGPSVLWVMLNPSTADAIEDDPTIRRVVGFSKAWGHGRAVVGNLYAYRTTKPADLLLTGDPVGPQNVNALRHHMAEAHDVVFAWGAGIKRLVEVGKYPPPVPLLAAEAGKEPVCLGMTREGYPRHPLYLAGDTAPVVHTEPWKAS